MSPPPPAVADHALSFEVFLHMRHLRLLAVAAGVGALLAQPAAAQDGRQFKDAWFWGVKGGSLVYSSATQSTGSAPLIGGEWLITRSLGGLYLSFDEAFLSSGGTYVDRNPDNTTFAHPVNLQNMRKFTIAAMVFPVDSRHVRPYFGIGLGLSQIGGVTLATATVNSTQDKIAVDSVEAKRTSFSPVVIGGAQFQLKPFSVFGQGTISPTQSSFFLQNPSGTRTFNFSIEGGIRFNVGSSIEGLR